MAHSEAKALLRDKSLIVAITSRKIAEFFNSVARHNDIALAPAGMTKVLRYVERGRRGAILPSLRDLEGRGDLAAKLDIIVFNPEMRSERRYQDDLEKLVEAACRGQQWAHEYGLEYIVSPGGRVAIAMAGELAPLSLIHI